MIKLSDRWIHELIAQPETGMGYQIVSVILKDGTRHNQVVVDSGFITRAKGLDSIPFQESDIREINVTHDKWDFKSQ